MQVNKPSSLYIINFIWFLISLLGNSLQIQAGCQDNLIKENSGLIIRPEGMPDSLSSQKIELFVENQLFKPSNTPVTNLIFYATGRFPEMRVSATGAGIMGSSMAFIRGYRYFFGDNQPLYVIDGLPITNLGHNSIEDGYRTMILVME